VGAAGGDLPGAWGQAAIGRRRLAGRVGARGGRASTASRARGAGGGRATAWKRREKEESEMREGKDKREEDRGGGLLTFAECPRSGTRQRFF
jgi:hypothetical protein